MILWILGQFWSSVSSTSLPVRLFRRARATRLTLHKSCLCLNSWALNRCVGTLRHGVRSCIQRGKLHQSEAYSTLWINYILYINILTYRSCGINCNKGKGELVKSTQGATFTEKSKFWFITTLLVHSQRLTHITLHWGNFPVQSSGLLFPCPPEASCPLCCSSLPWQQQKHFTALRWRWFSPGGGHNRDAQPFAHHLLWFHLLEGISPPEAPTRCF